jgi:hypothetical protein
MCDMYIYISMCACERRKTCGDKVYVSAITIYKLVEKRL